MSVLSVAESDSRLNTQDDAGAQVVKPGTKMQIVYGRVFVKAYPEIGRAAVAAGLSTPFRIWTLLRAIDPDGSGVVGYDAAMQCFAFYDLNRWHVLNALKVQAHEGVVFFTVSPKKFEYSSLYHVALALKVDRALTPVLIRTDDCHKLSRFNSAVYAAWLHTTGKTDGVMMSRATLGELWSKSDTQLRKWEKLQRISVQHNAVVIDTPQNGESAALEKELPRQVEERKQAAIPRDERLHDARLGRSYTWQRDGKTYYQTVNRFTARQGYTCRAGMTRKVAKRVRHELKSAAAVDYGATAKGEFERVFYSKTYLDGRDWQNSNTGSSLHETGETVNGRRQYRHGHVQRKVAAEYKDTTIVLDQRQSAGTLRTVGVKYHVWRFSPMRPAPKVNLI